MEEKIIGLLSELRPSVDFAAQDELIDGGILDSFDLISLVGELSELFGVSIGVEHIEPENFNSVARICMLIEKLADEK